MPRKLSTPSRFRQVALALAAIARQLRDDLVHAGNSAAESLAATVVLREFLTRGGHRGGCDSPALLQYESRLDDAEKTTAGRQALARMAKILTGDDIPHLLMQAPNPLQTAPLFQFVEKFLHEYDRASRRTSGAFYTPQPVVGYIVRSVLELAAEFGKSGNPIPALHFIDPAVGCGTFLLELYRQLPAAQLSGETSISGFELSPAPWLVANRLLSGDDSRAVAAPQLPLPRLHLANPLLAGDELANDILRGGRIPIIFGNPPYANFGKQNRGAWILGLLADYKHGLAERKLNLDDDFIKFIRWGQYWIEQAGAGVLAFVTSNTYLRGLTHRVMRQSLLAAFDELYFLDLHGSVNQRETTPGGGPDENVFPIKTGVAIGIFVRRSPRAATRTVRFAELWGARAEKFHVLETTNLRDTPWATLTPQPGQFLFAPPTGNGHANVGRASQPVSAFVPYDDIFSNDPYSAFWSLADIFPQRISGVQTKNDALWVGFTRQQVEDQVRAWLKANKPDAVRMFNATLIRSYLVAPFDLRWVYYDVRLLGRARHKVMRQMLHPNVGLVFMRQSTNPGGYDHFLAVNCLVSDRVFYSGHGAPFLAPLWLYADNDSNDAPQPNLHPQFLAALAQRSEVQPDPLDVFHYLYAAVSSPGYRQMFAAELRTDFPRIPWPRDRESYARLRDRGKRLASLHLSITDTDPTSSTSPNLSTPAYWDELLARVPAATRNFHCGGYAVVPRWIKQRRNLALSPALLAESTRLIAILGDTVCED